MKATMFAIVSKDEILGFCGFTEEDSIYRFMEGRKGSWDNYSLEVKCVEVSVQVNEFSSLISAVTPDVFITGHVIHERDIIVTNGSYCRVNYIEHTDVPTSKVSVDKNGKRKISYQRSDPTKEPTVFMIMGSIIGKVFSDRSCNGRNDLV